jgi:hypothetical protein
MKPYNFTGQFWWTLEVAIAYANERSKIKQMYFSVLKGPPYNPEVPDECWAITTRYDTRLQR